MISVCVNTKDRPGKLASCLDSIFANRFKTIKKVSFEVVVVDQSNRPTIAPRFKKRIVYVHITGKGTGLAKNIVIENASGKFVLFTDDDCMVDIYWIENVILSFNKYPDIFGVFGKVAPFRPELHPNEFCPCTFENKKVKIIRSPCLHYKHIGFGNNMSFRFDTLKKLGGFKSWLGPGSIGSNAEDAELALRALRNGYKLLYNPKVLVYHDRWLNTEELRKQNLSYVCGEVASYGCLALKGEKLAKKVVANNFRDSYFEITRAVKSLLLSKGRDYRLLSNALEEFLWRFRGLVVALYTTSLRANTPSQVTSA